MSQSKNTSVVIPYRPRDLQKLVHKERKRFTVLVTHRRFGKTVFTVAEQLKRAIHFGSEVRAWRAGYVAPYLLQAKRIVWDYLKYFGGVIPKVRINESELRLDLPNGARIQLFGADNPDALRGVYFDDLTIDEAATIPRGVWNEILSPTIVDRLGYVLFTGTPRGVNNLLFDKVQEADANPDLWAKFVFKASETGIIPADELARIKASISPELFEQEFECSFAAAVLGAYFAREIDELQNLGRIGLVPYEPALPVYTAWDLGMDDAMCIWFFQLEPSGDWRVFDYYENSGEGLEHYAGVVLAKGYTYARHIGPHDIMVRELGTGKSRLEVARSLGIRFDVCTNIPVMDGIDAVRLQLPRCWFDAGKCKEGLLALRQYQKVWNPKMEVFGKPVHDWTSHAADSFRYAVVGMRPEAPKHRQQYTKNKR